MITLAAGAARADSVANFRVNDGGWTASGSSEGAWTWDDNDFTGWSTQGTEATETTSATTFLTSPTLVVEKDGPVTGSFTHRFSFEFSSGEGGGGGGGGPTTAPTYYDGGQLQFSTNNGASWNTVPQSLFISTPYGGLIDDTIYISDISGQAAFVGDSPGYSDGTTFVTSTFTLGTGPAPYITDDGMQSFTLGQEIRVRFLGAWDNGGVADGTNWQITDISVVNAAPVPEPTAFALIAMGLSGLGTLRLRCRAR